MNHLSVRYSIAKTVLKLSGYKKIFGLPQDELVKKAEGYNKNRDFRLPRDHKFIYGDVPVCGGKYHCLTIQQSQTRTKRAILFFFGGGMLIGPDGSDVATAVAFGKDCGMDVWFPYYPLCTKHCITDTYEMAFDTYRKMTEVYGAENITNLGFSSGGMLAIGVCLHNNALGRPVPMPSRIIACSPGCCPSSEEQLTKMRELDEKDVMVGAGFMESIRSLMEHGRSDVPEYILTGTTGDFTGLPPIDFWYGSDEVLYACADAFTEACQKAGVTHTLTVGEGMCHCYPMVKWFPEGKKANEEICRRIRGESQERGL